MDRAAIKANVWRLTVAAVEANRQAWGLWGEGRGGEAVLLDTQARDAAWTALLEAIHAGAYD